MVSLDCRLGLRLTCYYAVREKYQPRHFTMKTEEEYRERTKIELACHIGNAYFMQTRYNTPHSSSPDSKLSVLDISTPMPSLRSIW